MLRLTRNKSRDRTRGRKHCPLPSRHFCGPRGERLPLALLAVVVLSTVVMLSSCGSGSYGGSQNINLNLSGNWQFTMAPPPDGSFFGGLQGGFLLQNNGSITGAATYAVSLSNLLIPCNAGSAAITGSISGQNVKTITAVAGTQTFTLAGTLSLDGTSMAGTYSSTAGTAPDGAPCGTAQTGLQWSAALVPPLTGPIQGTFHSSGGAAGLNEQDFLVSGALSQAPNTGASSAIVTGNFNFLNAITNVSDYPCLTVASAYGQISGNSVTLEIVGTDGSELGFIGEPVGSNGVTGVNPVTFDSVSGAYILHGAGPSYLVATTPCPGSLANILDAGDFGNICLALNGASTCQQPITITPSALIFPDQVVGAPPIAQTITLANTSGTNLGGVTLNLANNSGAANYTETDTCGLDGVPAQGQPFELGSGQSCVVTVSFAPLETCAPGTPPAQCPSPLNATLTVTSPNDDTILTVPITGTGISAGDTPDSKLTVNHHEKID
ncbi:MAG: hypothetical protein WBQ39_21080 [Terriglobales bacterium]